MEPFNNTSALHGQHKPSACRLLHSHNLLSERLLVGHESWPCAATNGLAWYKLGITMIWCILGKLQCTMGSCDAWESTSFPRGYWESLIQALTAGHWWLFKVAVRNFCCVCEHNSRAFIIYQDYFKMNGVKYVLVNSISFYYSKTYYVWPKQLQTDLKQVKHDDVIKWKLFPRYWPFVRGTHRSPVTCTIE